MQSTEDCWMVVHPYSKYEKAEMFADLFIFLTSSIFIMKYFFLNFSIHRFYAKHKAV